MQKTIFSDHILIYKPSENSFFSIFQRISGVFLSLLVLFFCFFNSFIFYFVFGFFIFLACFHYLNGLRIHFNESQISGEQQGLTYSLFLKLHTNFSYLILYFSLVLSFFLYIILIFFVV